MTINERKLRYWDDRDYGQFLANHEKIYIDVDIL